jgi:hypothetical protein
MERHLVGFVHCRRRKSVVIACSEWLDERHRDACGVGCGGDEYGYVSGADGNCDD